MRDNKRLGHGRAFATAVLIAMSCADGIAQTITTEPAAPPVASTPTPVPVDHPLALLALALGLCGAGFWWIRRMGVSMGTLRNVALGGIMLALGASSFWSDAVRAQLQLLQRQFTQADGETLAVPVQAVEVDGAITGFVPVEFVNATNKTLRIKALTAPTWDICFAQGIPAAIPGAGTSPVSPEPAKCDPGAEFAAGKTCRVDVTKLCADAAEAAKGAAPSVLGADAAAVNEGESVSGNVLANDSDADGPLLVASYVFEGVRHLVGAGMIPSVQGDFSLQAGGAFTFTAAKPFPALAAPIIKIGYTTHTGAVGELSITVNRTPKAVDDSPQVTENQPMSIAVLANDSDVDGDVLTVSAFTQGAHGSVVKESSGNLLYTPNSNYFGSDSFSYTVSDGKGLTATAQVHVTIDPANDAPVTANLSLTMPSNVSVNGSISASDVDGDTLSYAITGAPDNGAVLLNNATGSFSYTPSAGFSGVDSFVVTVSDGKGGTAVSTVTIVVTATNRAPTAVDNYAATWQDTSMTIAVLGNDTDPDGDALTVTGVTQGANGSVVIDVVTGNPIYTPNAGFTGTDSFTYTISDGNGGTDTATVTVTVNAVVPQLLAVDDSLTRSAENTPRAITFGELLVNDSGGVGNLSVVSVGNPQNGVVTMDSLGIAFTPTVNFEGQVSFQYTIKDEANVTKTATVRYWVGSATAPALVVSKALVIVAHGSGGVSAKFPIISKPVDTDGSESLSAKVSGVPAGFSFNAGVNLGAGVWQFAQADLPNLVINLPPSYASNAVHLTVQVISTESNGGATASVSSILTLKAAYTMVDVATIESGSFNGSSANEFIQGGAGNNTIDAGNGNNIVHGGDGNDTLSGSVGSDMLYGGAGDDIIDGGMGADVISGGPGNDTLKGGDAGENSVDVFVWTLGDQGAPGTPAIDTIQNFATAAPQSGLVGGDVLNLRDLLQGESVGPLNSAGNLADYLHFSIQGGNTLVHISHTGGFAADPHIVGAAFTSATETQTIVLEGANLQTLYAGATTDQQIITQLLNNNKLIVD